MENYFGGRIVAFKALVGSHNYNLNDESSDFQKAMTYNDTDEINFYLNIKYGGLSFDEFMQLAGFKMGKFLTLQDAYDKLTTNEKTYSKLKSLVRNSVRILI